MTRTDSVPLPFSSLPPLDSDVLVQAARHHPQPNLPSPSHRHLLQPVGHYNVKETCCVRNSDATARYKRQASVTYVSWFREERPLPLRGVGLLTPGISMPALSAYVRTANRIPTTTAIVTKPDVKDAILFVLVICDLIRGGCCLSFANTFRGNLVLVHKLAF